MDFQKQPNQPEQQPNRPEQPRPPEPQTPQTNPPVEPSLPPKSGGTWKVVLYTLLGVIVVAGIAYGAYYYVNQNPPVVESELELDDEIDVEDKEIDEEPVVENKKTTKTPVHTNNPITVQCTTNAWDCLVEAVNDGNNAEVLMTGGADLSPIFGMIISGTTRYKVTNVTDSDVTFSFEALSANAELGVNAKQAILDQGGTQADIDETIAMIRMEQQKTIGKVSQGIFTKTNFFSLINRWKAGGSSLSDWSPHTVLRDDYQADIAKEMLADGCEEMDGGMWFCPAMEGVTIN